MTAGTAVPPPRTPSAHRHRASPRARRLATERGVDLAELTGTGRAGRVTQADVLSAAAAQPPADRESDPARREPPTLPGPARAGGPAASPRTPEHFTTVVEADVSRVVELLDRVRTAPAGQDPPLTLTAVVARAAVEALRLHPMLNASIGDDGHAVVQHRAVHLGLALDTASGVLEPVVRDAGALNLAGLAGRAADLAERAHAGGIRPEDLHGATFTVVTQTAGHGALYATPVLRPGQAGALGAGAVVERPVVVRTPDGERGIAVRSMAYLALTCDHRIVGPAAAAGFLATVRDRLQGSRLADELRLGQAR